MNTYSHFLIHKSLATRLHQPKALGLVIGSFLPDLPLYSLTALTFIHHRFFTNLNFQTIFQTIFRDYYFNHHLWISAHNLLHSPTSLATLFVTTRLLPISNKLKTLLIWILIGSLFHSAIDILTHHSDGPLLLWPLNWNLRFLSPISYWERGYFARQFFYFEHILDIVLIAYLLKTRTQTKPTVSHQQPNTSF